MHSLPYASGYAATPAVIYMHAQIDLALPDHEGLHGALRGSHTQGQREMLCREIQAIGRADRLDCGHCPLPSDVSAISCGYITNQGPAIQNPDRSARIGGKVFIRSQGPIIWRICYDCAAELDKQAARNGHNVSGYVHSPAGIIPHQRCEGWTITTFGGRTLGVVTSVRKSPARWQGNRWIPPMYYVRANVQGKLYFGACQGPGMHINLRPMKG